MSTACFPKDQPLVWVLDDEFENLAFEKSLLEDAGIKFAHSTSLTFARDYPVYAPLADAVLMQVSFRINTAQALGLTKCKIISVLGVGYDNVPLEAANERGILVCTVPDYCVAEVSDHTMALLLALARRVTRFNNEVRQGSWQPIHNGMFCLAGQILGLVGFGRIARAVAKKAAAFDLRVLSCDPYVEARTMAALNTEKADLATLLKRSDYVSLHVPLESSTKSLIGPQELSLMKRNACLINTSRGSLIDEHALAEALRNGVIAGAALDVMQEEPPEANNYLLKTDKTIITPHVAYYSEQSLLRLRRTAVENVIRALEGEQPVNVINFPALAYIESASERTGSAGAI
jgi:D-3-phosphoglycerate dehydrogenase